MRKNNQQIKTINNKQKLTNSINKNNNNKLPAAPSASQGSVAPRLHAPSHRTPPPPPFSGKQTNFNFFSNPQHTSTSGSGSNDIIGSLGASSIKNSSPSSSLASSLSRMTLATLIMMMIGMTTLIMTMVMTGMTMSMTSTPP